MKKLNLGSGFDYKRGWINVDINNKDIYGRKIKIDVKHDLNKSPWPFKKNEFDFVLMKGVLEHMSDIDKTIKELARITKTGAKIKISVPYFTSYFAYRELYTHKFSLNALQLFGIFKKYRLIIISKKLRNNNKFLKWIEIFVNFNESTQNFYERFFSGIFPMNQIEWVLRVEK
ncbi:methyltransferase domain-containing protein [Candidatus Pacearchaeota archaeon]|nr:methyltransferase domain-containing protein [Candidatus Pacearchaeota archaeon]